MGFNSAFKVLKDDGGNVRARVLMDKVFGRETEEVTGGKMRSFMICTSH